MAHATSGLPRTPFHTCDRQLGVEKLMNSFFYTNGKSSCFVCLDHLLWQLTAFCAGTGGSLLIIGSVAGVTFMNMEGVTFGWYFRNISAYAFIGYASGFFSLLMFRAIF